MAGLNSTSWPQALKGHGCRTSRLKEEGYVLDQEELRKGTFCGGKEELLGQFPVVLLLVKDLGTRSVVVRLGLRKNVCNKDVDCSLNTVAEFAFVSDLLAIIQ